MDTSHVDFEIRDRVGVLHLRRGRGNALNAQLVEDLLEALRRPELVDDCDALVLAGSNGFFSAGLDLVELGEFDEARMLVFVDRLQGLLQTVFMWSRPVIAAVSGHAIAGGCLLAQCADWRVLAAEGAKIGVNELDLGLPLPQAGLEILRSQLSASAWAEVVYGAALHEGEAARALGLADEVCESAVVLDRAVERARDWGSRPPIAFHRMKAARRDPVLLAIRDHHEQRQQEWVNLWFSSEARPRLQSVRERLLAKRN